MSSRVPSRVWPGAWTGVPVRLSSRPRPALGSARALRAVESFLLSGGQQTARRNAWAAVEADRRRARDRSDAARAMAALAAARTDGGAGLPR